MAKEYSQIEGIEFYGVFALGTRYATVRITTGFLVKLQCRQKVLDVRNAFRNGDLKEQIYINNLKASLLKVRKIEYIACENHYLFRVSHLERRTDMWIMFYVCWNVRELTWIHP